MAQTLSHLEMTVLTPSPLMQVLFRFPEGFHRVAHDLDGTFKLIQATFGNLVQFHGISPDDYRALQIPESYAVLNTKLGYDAISFKQLYWLHLLQMNLYLLDALRHMCSTLLIYQPLWFLLKPHVLRRKVMDVIQYTHEQVGPRPEDTVDTIWQGVLTTCTVIWQKSRTVTPDMMFLSTDIPDALLYPARSSDQARGFGKEMHIDNAPSPARASDQARGFEKEMHTDSAPSPWPHLSRLADLVGALADAHPPLQP